MKVVSGVSEMRRIVLDLKKQDRTVGLVPTMGFFHEGHVELMRRARADCDAAVVSLFVNPTQFGPGEDYADYPRDFERDRAMAAGAGVDFLFAPDASAMYPERSSTHVEVEGLSCVMCGIARPSHFRGVATVVAKLFNIVPADRAYFGQKDAQQLAVIRRMAADLDFDVVVVGVPTVRESDGLAMSSRNVYLTGQERTAAPVLFRSLQSAEALARAGERSARVLKSAVEDVTGSEPLVDLEYIAICDNISLKPLSTLTGEVLIALAARVGKARLIDNVLIEIE